MSLKKRWDCSLLQMSMAIWGIRADRRRTTVYGPEYSSRDPKGRESNLVRHLNMALLSHFPASRPQAGHRQAEGAATPPAASLDMLPRSGKRPPPTRRS